MTKIKILTFQYNSVYQHGGAGRVLRRLFEGREEQVTSLYLQTGTAAARTGLIREVAVPVFPLQRTWMRWRLRNLAIWLRESFFKDATIKNITKAAAALEFDVIHAVNHGPFSTALCDPAFAGKPLWVSFHDHFSTCSSFEDTKLLWDKSARRLTISKEMGVEYQHLFGQKDFEVITDGVSAAEVSEPATAFHKPLVIYFAGLLHLDYLELFRTLADALDRVAQQGTQVKLMMRGTQRLDFLQDRSFEVDYRQDFVSDAAIKQELDAADILYLPIKFNLPDFYLYSLSTKMVSYLGGAGTILYHGPANSAACNLLTAYNAASCATSLESEALKENILQILQGTHNYAANAKVLAQKEFDLTLLQNRFWQTQS